MSCPYTLWLVNTTNDSASLEALEDYETLGRLLDDCLTHWNEEPEGPQTFLVTNGLNGVVVTLTREMGDPEVAIVTYAASGEQERIRCHYVLDECGHYERTDMMTLSDTLMA